MNYREVIQYMETQFPFFQQSGNRAYKPGLDNIKTITGYLGNPHLKLRHVHIAGTNGKGSTAHLIASVLMQAGYRTGLFTSPHLNDYRERIRINGQMMPEQDVVSFIETHRAFLEKVNPSFFEVSTAMAFDFFAREKIDIAVIETGLGGRMDSTNIITPLVSVITNIGYDHKELLGEKTEQIAAEKAGIIKTGTPAVIGETQSSTTPIFTEKATCLHAPLFFADRQYAAQVLEIKNNYRYFNIFENGKLRFENLCTDLLGSYQSKNIITALKTLEVISSNGFTIQPEHLFEGMRNAASATGLRGRWEVLKQKPYTVCDTAHNKDGLTEALRQIKSYSYRQLHIVIGFVKEKDIREILPLLPVKATYYFTQPASARALSAAALAQMSSPFGLTGEVYDSVMEAYNIAQQNAHEHDMIFIGGSNYVVAEIL